MKTRRHTRAPVPEPSIPALARLLRAMACDNEWESDWNNGWNAALKYAAELLEQNGRDE